MRRTLWIPRALGLAAAVAMTALGAPRADAQLAGSEIHIGVGAPLTTGSATFGVEMRQAPETPLVDALRDDGDLVALGHEHVAERHRDALDSPHRRPVTAGHVDDLQRLASPRRASPTSSRARLRNRLRRDGDTGPC